MRNFRNLLLLTLVVGVFIGAGSLWPQLPGIWAGTGKGNCHPPGYTIYPWQKWKGEIPNSGDVFFGEWCDKAGEHGDFKGEVYYLIPLQAVSIGKWSWDNPDVPSQAVGDFRMEFFLIEKNVCEGVWTSIYPSTSAQGTMKGKRSSRGG